MGISNPAAQPHVRDCQRAFSKYLDHCRDRTNGNVAPDTETLRRTDEYRAPLLSAVTDTLRAHPEQDQRPSAVRHPFVLSQLGQRNPVAHRSCFR